MKVVRSVLVLILAGFFALLTAPTASADTIECNGKIVDQTSERVLTGNAEDEQAILAAIRNVEAFGPDVYVRAFQNTPGGNADAFWEQGFRQCSNWRTPNGEAPKGNVIVVTFGMDRTQGIFFNSGKYPVLQSRFDAIEKSDMGANFRGGDFAQGITSALNSIKVAVDPSTPVEKGTDFGAFFKWLGIFLGVLCAMALVIFGIYRLVKSRRERREIEERRVAAQSAARKAKADASNEVASAMSDEQLEARFLLAAAGLPKVMADVHRKSFDAIDDSCDEQMDAFATLNADMYSDPENNKLTEPDYIEQRDEYGYIAESLRTIAAKYTALFTAIEADKAELTPEARTAKWETINRDALKLRAILTSCDEVFDVAPEKEQLGDLLARLQDAQELLSQSGEQQTVDSFEQLEKLENETGRLAGQFEGLMSTRSQILGARRTFQNDIAKRRDRLGRLQHVRADGAIAELDKTEAKIDEHVTSLNSTRSRTKLLDAIAKFGDDVSKVGRSQVAEDDKIEARHEAERRRKREAEEAERREKTAKRRREEEEAAERRRRDDEDRRRRNDSFSGGFAGGAIGGSFGSSSSSSGGFGGGGSSWGGGGSDFGGGGSSW